MATKLRDMKFGANVTDVDAAGNINAGVDCTSGSKFFVITGGSKDTKTFVFGNATAEEFALVKVGYKCACEASGQPWICFGSVTAVDAATKTITVDNYISYSDPTSASRKNFWFPDHPEIGSETFGISTLSGGIKGGCVASGEECVASLQFAHAEGDGTRACGKRSHAEGAGTYAGHCAHAEGSGCQALAYNSHAEGCNTKTWSCNLGSNSGARNSHAEGNATQCIATRVSSGTNCEASHAEGNKTTTDGDYCHAEGSETYAMGSASHAEGQQTRTNPSAGQSHAEGSASQTFGAHSHADGVRAITVSGETEVKDLLVTKGDLIRWDGTNWTIDNESTDPVIAEYYLGGTDATHKTALNNVFNSRFDPLDVGISSFTVGLYKCLGYSASSAEGSKEHLYWRALKSGVTNHNDVGAYCWSSQCMTGSEGSENNFHYHTYRSHGSNTFNINPHDGLKGFYIGEKNFVQQVIEAIKLVNSDAAFATEKAELKTALQAILS